MKKLSIALLLSVFVITGCGTTEVEEAPPDVETNETNKSNNEKPTASEKETFDYVATIEEISLSDKSHGTKYFETKNLADRYDASSDELNEFKDYTLQEFKNENYKNKLGDDKYSLELIFKSYVASEYANNEKYQVRFSKEYYAREIFKVLRSTYPEQDKESMNDRESAYEEADEIQKQLNEYGIVN